ncbi:MAG: hypothetical protein WCK47_09050 [bacterium]|nr:hypothetical protein [Candidatus Sumerlaeota bacterium]
MAANQARRFDLEEEFPFRDRDFFTHQVAVAGEGEVDGACPACEEGTRSKRLELGKQWVEAHAQALRMLPSSRADSP